MSKAFIEHETGFVDLASVEQVNFSTARGGTIAVATSRAAEGSYGHVVAHLDPESQGKTVPAPIAAELPSETQLEEITSQLRTLSRGLLATKQRLAAFPDDSVHIVTYDAKAQRWNSEPAKPVV